MMIWIVYTPLIPNKNSLVLFWWKERSHISVWCFESRTWCLLVAGWKTDILYVESINTDRKKLRSNWKIITSSSFWNENIRDLHILKTNSRRIRNRSRLFVRKCCLPLLGLNILLFLSQELEYIWQTHDIYIKKIAKIVDFLQMLRRC